VDAAAAVSALAVTLGLALRRPLLPRGVRVGPGLAAGLGVAILVVTGVLDTGDVTAALEVLWRPLVTLASIMVTTGVAARVGLFHQLAAAVVTGSGARAG
jgi:Na+/H+ antiporter NhaD/arsenite permease-like protein